MIRCLFSESIFFSFSALHQTVTPYFTAWNAFVSGFFHFSNSYFHTKALTATYIATPYFKASQSGEELLGYGVSVGVAVRCEPSRGTFTAPTLYPAYFSTQRKIKKAVRNHTVFNFSNLPSNRLIWAFFFLSGTCSLVILYRHTGDLWT